MAEPVANGVANGHSAEAEYEPQRILITGGAGFIASHVTRRLIKNYPKYKVRCCSNCRPCHWRLFGAWGATGIVAPASAPAWALYSWASGLRCALHCESTRSPACQMA